MAKGKERATFSNVSGKGPAMYRGNLCGSVKNMK